MFYDFKISTAKEITYENRSKTRLKLAKGSIVQCSFLFPPGSIGLLYLQIFRGINQLYPFNTGGFFNTTNETIAFIDDYRLDEPPYELIAHVWNLDDTFEHSVYIRFNVLPLKKEKEEIPRETLLQAALRKLGL